MDIILVIAGFLSVAAGVLIRFMMSSKDSSKMDEQHREQLTEVKKRVDKDSEQQLEQIDAERDKKIKDLSNSDPNRLADRANDLIKRLRK